MATETCTDLIVRAMESADDMDTVIVIYRLKDAGTKDRAGVGWHSNATTFEALGMIEMAKAGLLSSPD